MAYVSATPRTELSVNANWFVDLVDGIKLSLERSRAYRQTYAELSMMSERELADINLSGLSIREVAREAAARVH